MTSSSTHPGAAEDKSILTPVMILEGHEPRLVHSPDGKHYEYKGIWSISYFPDCKQMVSGSRDYTIRRWDLREGKEIEKARKVCKNEIRIVEVSRDGRWLVTVDGWELKVREIKTGIVRTFHEYSWTKWIDISADSTLLAGASLDSAVQIWNLDTGQLMAGPFELGDGDIGDVTIRLSEDSRKLAVAWSNTDLENRLHLEVWDVQAQKLDVQKSTAYDVNYIFPLPVFWTTKDNSIVAAFTFTYDDPAIYEFDASTLETVGAPFKGHTSYINSLALSPDCTLLASSSYDTIKLWSFGPRQLLASFDVKLLMTLVLSPNSRQLAYTTWHETKIHICNIPANILASIGLAEEPQPSTSKPKRSRHAGLLDFDITPRPVRRKPVMIPVTPIPQPLPAENPHVFHHFLRKFLSFSSPTDVTRTDDPRNPLDFPATSPLPRSLLNHDGNSRSTPAPLTAQSSIINTFPTIPSRFSRLSTWRPFQTDHTSPAVVHVPLAPGKLRYATAGAPSNDDGLIRDEDYVPPSPSSPNAGQHGRGRFCFCF
ncbi:WD40 repeat-like protein [Suillus decipiens]|nr:WD40 repeat-like protein [Suillus decipiens]